MTTGTIISLALVVVGDLVLLLACGWHRDVTRALAQALGRPGPPEALRRSAGVWEALARSTWLLTAMAAVVGFTRVMGAGPGIHELVPALAEIAMATAGGWLVTVALAIPAVRLTRRATRAALRGGGEPSPDGPPPVHAPDLIATCLGLALFALLLAWALALSARGGSTAWLLHWPAWLVVAGGTLALALYLGDPTNGWTLTTALAGAGTLGTLAGLAQACHGFAVASIERVTGGLMLVLGCGFASLVGLAMLGLPLHDRAVRRGMHPGDRAWSRLAAGLLPAVALLGVLLAVGMVMIPIVRKAG